jgi:CheY-like chemotaxis protein
VIADYSLPGQGGIELLRTVRRAKKRVVPFLVIKGRADVYSVRAALPLQPTAYLTEPFRAERVLSHVQTVLSGFDAPPAPVSIEDAQSLGDYLQGLRGRAEGAPMLGGVYTRDALIVHFAARYSRAQDSSQHAMAALLEGKAARMLGVTLEMLEGIPAAA